MKHFGGIHQIAMSSSVQTCLSHLAILHYGSLELEFEDMVRKFIQVSPWSAWPPLTWRNPPARDAKNSVITTVTLCEDTQEVMLHSIAQINLINRHTVDHTEITPKVFLYTAIVWWTTYVYAIAAPV